MAKVKVRYLGVMREKTGTKTEEIDAQNLSELIDELGRRYEEMRPYLREKETTDPTLIVSYNGLSIKDIRNCDKKLNDGDEIILMSVIGGG